MALHWTYTANFFDTTQSPYVPLVQGVSTIGERDQIRFLIQDTRTARQLIYDEEIDWTQTQEANTYMAAARCCETLILRFGPLKMKKVGDLQEEFDIRFYQLLAADLRARGMTYQTPYVGGISIADKIAQENDPDWVAPRVGMTTFDNPGARQPGPSVGDVTGGDLGFPSH
jgi:hypothetical protein